MLVDKGLVYGQYEIVSLTKGRFLKNNRYSDNLFVVLQDNSLSCNEDKPYYHKEIFLNASPQSFPVFVPEKLKDIIKTHWEYNQDIFLSFDIKEKDDSHTIYQIKSCMTLTRFDA